MFDIFRDPELPTHGSWTYRRRPDGGLVQIPPGVCPRGHPLGPGRARLIWEPGLCETIVSCNVCYDADPNSAMWRAEEPEWMVQFRALCGEGRKIDAMALIDAALPMPRKPAGPTRGPGRDTYQRG